MRERVEIQGGKLSSLTLAIITAFVGMREVEETAIFRLKQDLQSSPINDNFL